MTCELIEHRQERRRYNNLTVENSLKNTGLSSGNESSVGIAVPNILIISIITYEQDHSRLIKKDEKQSQTTLISHLPLHQNDY